MKICPECRIQVGGNGDVCPLCKAKLSGEGSPGNWPRRPRIKTAANIFRAQFVLLVLAGLVESILYFNEGAIVILIWILAGEFLFLFARKRRMRAGDIILAATIALLAPLLITAIWYPWVTAAVPVILIIIMVLNCVLALVLRNSQSIFCFIITSIIFAATWVVNLIWFEISGPVWLTCLAVGAGCFLVMCIVNGRRMRREVKKVTVF